MTKIVPAILESELSAYRQKLNLVRQLTDRFQLDVIDGEYVDNRTLQPQDISPPSGMKLDIHLMVARPHEYIPACIKLRPYTILVQFEALAEAEQLRPILEKINNAGLRSGVALNPATDLSSVSPVFDAVNYVLLMAYPAGFAGQKLDRRVLTRVNEVRTLAPHAEVGLDGGVNASSLKAIAAANFDIVNTNTYLFNTDSPLTRYHELIGALA